MFRKIISAAVLACALFAAGCAADKPAAQLDVSAAAQTLLDSGLFAQEMTNLSDDTAGELALYADNSAAQPEDLSESALYKAVGTSADTILVIKCADNAQERMSKAVSMYVEDRISAAEFYLPDEVEKLNNAVLKMSGNYIVLAVAEDSQAAETAVDALISDGEHIAVSAKGTTAAVTSSEPVYDENYGSEYDDYDEKY